MFALVSMSAIQLVNTKRLASPCKWQSSILCPSLLLSLPSSLYPSSISPSFPLPFPPFVPLSFPLSLLLNPLPPYPYPSHSLLPLLFTPSPSLSSLLPQHSKCHKRKRKLRTSTRRRERREWTLRGGYVLQRTPSSDLTRLCKRVESRLTYRLKRMSRIWKVLHW